MVVNGYVIEVELECVREMNRLLSNISNNINQIAKRVNESRGLHKSDIVNIQACQEEIWVQQKEILYRLNKIFDAAK